MSALSRQATRVYNKGYSEGYRNGREYLVGMENMPLVVRADLLLIEKLISKMPQFDFLWPDEWKTIWFNALERMNEWRRDLLRESEKYHVGYTVQYTHYPDCGGDTTSAEDMAA